MAMSAKSTVMTFSHTQNVKLALYELLFGYDNRAVLIGTDTSKIVADLLSDIESHIDNGTSAFLRDVYPELYKKFALENNSDTLLALIYCLLNSSRMSTTFSENGLALYAERPQYPSFYGSSLFAPCANRLLACSTSRALQTALCISNLFPLDPLFFVLTSTKHFPINWIYMHFSPTSPKKTLYEHRQFEFLQIQFFHAHKDMLYDLFKHYADPYAAYLFAPDDWSLSTNDFIPVSTTASRRHWTCINPLANVKDFATFFAYFLYFVYFYKSTLPEAHLVASYGRRLRIGIMGYMARRNKIAHTICVCLREAAPELDTKDAVWIIENLIKPLNLHKIDNTYDSWTHSLVPMSDASSMRHADLVYQVHEEAKTRAKTLSIVNNTIMSVYLNNEPWQDASAVFDPDSLRFIVIGGSIGKTLVYTTRPAMMLLNVSHDDTSTQNVLYLMVSVFKNRPVRTRRRAIVVPGVLGDDFRITLVDAATGSVLYADFAPLQEHIYHIMNTNVPEPAKSFETRFAINSASRRLIHSTYFMDWSKSIDRVFPSAEAFWSSGIYVLDIEYVRANNYLYANTAIQDVLVDTVGIIYKPPYYLYTPAALLDTFNMNTKTDYAASWQISYSSKRTSFYSSDNSISYEFLSFDYHTYSMSPRFARTESKLKSDVAVKNDLEVREYVPIYATDPSIWIVGMNMGLNFSMPNALVNVLAPVVRGGYVWYSYHYQPAYSLSSGSTGPSLILLVDVEFVPIKPLRIEQFNIVSEHVVFEVGRKYTRNGALNFVIYVYAASGFQTTTNLATCGFWVNDELILQVQLKANHKVTISANSSTGDYSYGTNVWSTSTAKINKIVPAS